MTTEAISTESAAGTLDVMRRVLQQRFDIHNPALDTDTKLSELGLDSLSFVEYAFELETELRIHLPDIPSDITTIGDFAKYVHNEVVRQGASPT